jgi:tetratricopeptide (TPR) repeat protein
MILTHFLYQAKVEFRQRLIKLRALAMRNKFDTRKFVLLSFFFALLSPPVLSMLWTYFECQVTFKNIPTFNWLEGLQYDLFSSAAPWDIVWAQRLARWRLIKGDLRGSLSECNRALSLRGDQSITYDLLGIIYERSGDFSKANDAFASAVKLTSKNPQICIDRGWLFKQMGAYDLALIEFERAETLTPGISAAPRSQINFLRSRRSIQFPKKQSSVLSHSCLTATTYS